MLDDIREWISDNLRYIMLGAGVILVLLILIGLFRLVTGSGKSKGSENKQATSAQVDDNKSSADTKEEEQVTEGTDTSDEAGSSAASIVLNQNDSNVLARTEEYYEAVSAGNTVLLAEMLTPWDDNVRAEALDNGDIESYENIQTYSTDGLEAGEYLVYVSYEAKISEIDTTVPSLVSLYMTSETGGVLKIRSDASTDSKISSYIAQTSSSREVQALVQQTNNAYRQAIGADEKLAAYVEAQSASTTNDDTSSDDETTTTTKTSSVAVGSTMTATVTLNIRQTASTSAAIMGMVPEGTSVTVTGDETDGWVPISYNASGTVIEGYVMLQYLTTAGSGENASADNAA